MRFKGNTGHTLTEVMISVAIFTTIIAGIYVTLYVGNISWAIQDASVSVQDQARRTIGKLTRDLRVGQGIAINEVADEDGTTIDIAFTRGSEGNVTYDWTTVAGTSQYQLIRTNSEGAIIVARDVSALSFTETSSDIKIDVTVTTQMNQNEAVSYSLVGNVARR